ncbi:hypothetical protein HDU97_007852 [Phlyctochytrium planicorne]|nr:hypothetical protein HDU97_007852 [Phlyctochytrium planicorne]
MLASFRLARVAVGASACLSLLAHNVHAAFTLPTDWDTLSKADIGHFPNSPSVSTEAPAPVNLIPTITFETINNQLQTINPPPSLAASINPQDLIASSAPASSLQPSSTQTVISQASSSTAIPTTDPLQTDSPVSSSSNPGGPIGRNLSTTAIILILTLSAILMFITLFAISFVSRIPLKRNKRRTYSPRVSTSGTAKHSPSPHESTTPRPPSSASVASTSSAGYSLMQHEVDLGPEFDVSYDPDTGLEIVCKGGEGIMQPGTILRNQTVADETGSDAGGKRSSFFGMWVDSERGEVGKRGSISDMYNLLGKDSSAESSLRRD